MNKYFKDEYPLLESCVWYKNKIEKEGHEQEVDIVHSKYQEFIKNKSAIVPKINLYFGYYLHDSKVIGIQYENNSLKIVLNDFSSCCFADAISYIFNSKSSSKKRIMPVTLVINEINQCTIYRINRNGKKIPVKFNRYTPLIEEFLYDELKVVEKNKIAGAILFISNTKNKELVLEFSGKQLTFIEDQECTFIKLFGNDLKLYWDHYWKKRCEGEYFDYSRSIAFIKEFEK